MTRRTELAAGGGTPRGAQLGFTLVEMIVSITLVSLLAVMAAPLMRLPMLAWLDASRRTELSSAADLLQSKLSQDLARALPNSVRIRLVGGRTLLEYLEVRAHGRPRLGNGPGPALCPAVCSAPGGNDRLEAGCNETCFVTLGPLLGDPPVAGSDWVVVNPLGPGVAGGDPYFGGNAAVVGGIKARLTAATPSAGNVRVQHAAHSYPALPTSGRVYLVSSPVTYECNPTAQSLLRHSRYAMAATQPAAFGGADTVPLLRSLAACSISYTPAGAPGRGGVVSLALRLARASTDTGAPEAAEMLVQVPVVELP